MTVFLTSYNGKMKWKIFSIYKIEVTTDYLKTSFLDDESWFVLRPSGTEPKLKVYFSTVGATMEKAINKNNKLRTEVMKLIEKIK